MLEQSLHVGGQWLPEIKELAGGECDWQEGGDPPERIEWDQVLTAVLLSCICWRCGLAGYFVAGLNKCSVVAIASALNSQASGD